LTGMPKGDRTMADNCKLTPEAHSAQIEAFIKVRPDYETYAAALKRVLERACSASLPEALVQSRAKTVSSFAEKVARKFAKYPDAVNQLTDLCGARVIVQTAEQVRAVRGFIETNFVIVESDDKGLLLSKDEFGYRDMHYIIRLDPARAGALGFTPQETAAIAAKPAEVQVRTWLQHAWADTLHDRIYKNTLKLSPEVLRNGALLAALMEEGDRNFNALADDLDGLIANYTAFATKAQVKKEIDVQRLILGNERSDAKKPGLALKLARLLAANGDHDGVVALLSEWTDKCPAALRPEMLLELGHSLCRKNRAVPGSGGYQQGRRYLADAVRHCAAPDHAFVPHLRGIESLHARALMRLGAAIAAIPGEEHEARECLCRAHEHEPSNPYYLAAMLGSEMRFSPHGALPAAMATTIRAAVRTCLQHAAAGIELPYSCFTAGRLSLLVGGGYDALEYFARGILHCLAGVFCVPADFWTDEIAWIQAIHYGNKPPAESQQAIDLLLLGRSVATGDHPAAANNFKLPVVIVAGAAAHLDAAIAVRLPALFKDACGQFHGTIISGGTTAGVPGAVGDAAKDVEAGNGRRFRLIGYRPGSLPDGVAIHPQYDEHVTAGDKFSPEQVIRYCSDLLAKGVSPREVLLLGVGGGPISALEYRIALALGATVGVVAGSGGAAAELMADPLWCNLPNLFELPFDAATIRAFVMPTDGTFDAGAQEEMAKCFHARYVASSTRRLPPAMRPWDKLDPTFRRANLEQAHYSVEILEAAGFIVRKADGVPKILADLSDAEVEHMAELEHGRWNIERLRDGWRYDRQRDDARKRHDCIVDWNALPDDIRQYDRDAVRVFPEILAKAGLEVVRR